MSNFMLVIDMHCKIKGHIFSFVAPWLTDIDISDLNIF